MNEEAMAKIESMPFYQLGYQKGLADGHEQVVAIRLAESNYGATQSAVSVLRGKSREEVRKKCDEFRWRKNGENPGQIYMSTCEVVRAPRKTEENDWEAIVIIATHRDI